MKMLAKGFFGALFLTTAMSVAAFPVNVTTVNGTFENTQNSDGNSVSGDGTSLVKWGDTGFFGNKPQSSYGFTGESSLPMQVNDDSIFSLGTLTHTNKQVSGPTLTATDLAITLGFSGFGDADTQQGVFVFSHTETPDNGTYQVCTFFGLICWDKHDGVIDDIVAQTGTSVSSSSFILGGFEYSLELLGMSTDGSTPENTVRDYELWAKLNATALPVPEPGTLALLGLGLAGLGMTRRCKSA